ncbi:hypothetical protein BP6252_13196 [Coleophoma cylindrospora]|uniref:Transcription factor domain-containing protein n=1 Tax=Coleophoma cylindrospora TaxID=1849047 RepID=A0A3D8QAQ0_9HELO|nr:hypothetical protein BP6252_13196 [Coleophoma cylindrospora]
MAVSRFTLYQEIPLLAPVTKSNPKTLQTLSLDEPWDGRNADYTLESLVTRPMTTPSPTYTRPWSSGVSPVDDIPGQYQYDSSSEFHDDQMDLSFLQDVEQNSTTSKQEIFSMPTKDTDIMALYLDTVFYEIYPFFSLRKNNLEYRGWLLTMVISKGPAQQACFGLSLKYVNALAAGRCTREFLEGTQCGLQAKYYYGCAIESLSSEIAQWIRNRGHQCLWQRREKTIELLFCISQLIMFEIYQDGHSSLWKTHFQGGFDLIADIPPWHELPSSTSACFPTTSKPNTNNIQLYNSTDFPMSPASSMYSSCSQTNCSRPHHTYTQAVSCKFVYLFFIHLDIVLASSTRTPLKLLIDHLALLSTSQREQSASSNISSIQLFGLEEWALLNLCKVIQLETLKNELTRTAQLSMARLVEQGTVIEAQIKQSLRITPMYVASSRSSPHQQPNILLEQYELSTIRSEIYAHATLIYLHVLLSGPLFLLPEIRNSVKAAISLLKVLSPQHRQLRALRWPLAVLFCLAQEDERSWLEEKVANKWASMIAQNSRETKDWAQLPIL